MKESVAKQTLQKPPFEFFLHIVRSDYLYYFFCIKKIISIDITYSYSVSIARIFNI